MPATLQVGVITFDFRAGLHSRGVYACCHSPFATMCAALEMPPRKVTHPEIDIRMKSCAHQDVRDNRQICSAGFKTLCSENIKTLTGWKYKCEGKSPKTLTRFVPLR